MASILEILSLLGMGDTPQRIPYASESDFFGGNPNVQGMATQDNNVILNPYSDLSEEEKDAVLRNERARVWMRQNQSPNFYITPEQQSSFRGYGNQDDVASTIAARLFSGDSSAGRTTQEQQDWVNRFLRGRY